ncbi:MAG TPA: glycosyltransferase family 4 protein [Pseudonocardia sp.]|nr:glycosyltransferase family 4 protein [Pseudonocardia sp.]
MRITLIGPAFPWRGGIPLWTTDLARRLTGAGHHVTLRNWTHQGPARLLPAERHPLTAPESDVYPTVDEPLSWNSPAQWWRTGQRAAAESDVVVLTFYTTLQALALWAIALCARRHARVVLICHNVVPHEARPGDRPLLAMLARAVDAVLVHTWAQHDALAVLTDQPAAVAALPPHLPIGERRPTPTGVEPKRRLLFFGKVRHYKGVDVLLRAVARMEGVHLSIVGEFYQNLSELITLIAELDLADRVRVHPEYLPAEHIPELFTDADALVLPYRKATASQFVALAQFHGLPVVATRVGNFPDAVRHGVDGLLCEPGDVDDLAAALRRLYEPGQLDRLRAAVRPAETESSWRNYLDTLDELIRRPGGRTPRPAPRLGAVLGRRPGR